MTDKHKEPIHEGKVGRPKEITILGSSQMQDRGLPEIVGGASATGDVRILDPRTGDPSPPPEITAHEEIRVEDEDSLRPTPKNNPEVEIRVRASDQASWEKLKRGEEDGS